MRTTRAHSREQKAACRGPQLLWFALAQASPGPLVWPSSPVSKLPAANSTETTRPLGSIEPGSQSGRFEPGGRIHCRQGQETSPSGPQGPVGYALGALRGPRGRRGGSPRESGMEPPSLQACKPHKAEKQTQKTQKTRARKRQGSVMLGWVGFLALRWA